MTANEPRPPAVSPGFFPSLARVRYAIPTPVRRAPTIAWLAAIAASCDADGEAALDRASEAPNAQLEYESPTAGEEPEPPAPTPSIAATPKQDVAPPREPIAVRIARQMLVLRTAPDPDAPLRGRIPLGEAFEVFAWVPGASSSVPCGGKGWADLGDGAFACLEPSRRAVDVQPRALPEMRDGDLAPFFYAHVKAGQPARRWKNLASLRAGEPHMDALEPEHDYAFVTRRRIDGQLVLIDDKDRVVLESEVSRYRPSRFEGRDLLAHPVPEGKLLAWTASWPETNVVATASDTAALARALDYQEEILVAPTAVRNDEGVWFEVDGGGFVAARDIRRWVPAPPPADIADDELWIDVELDSQTLTVTRGSVPEFATLVSTGFKGPTPKGIFRISMKHTLGQMRSRPDSDEPYNVEAVPFIQYFTGNFALHGAFWHYRFGHKISHGCVNLAPKDARRIFGLTTPHVRRGWQSSYESESHLGTTVRVRKGDEPVVDKRTAVQPLEG